MPREGAFDDFRREGDDIFGATEGVRTLVVLTTVNALGGWSSPVDVSTQVGRSVIGAIVAGTSGGVLVGWAVSDGGVLAVEAVYTPIASRTTAIATTQAVIGFLSLLTSYAIFVLVWVAAARNDGARTTLGGVT